MGFKVEIKGLPGVKKQFETAAKDIVSTVSQEFSAMGQDWVAGAVKDAPVDQGGLKSSISFRQSETHTAGGSGVSIEIVAQKFYAPFIEFGTKGNYQAIPGTEGIAQTFKGYKGGDFSEMLRMITMWVKRKGITGRYSVKTRRRLGSKSVQASEDQAAAWPIVMSILKHGIKPHPYFFKQQETVWPAMIKRVKAKIESGAKISVIAPGEIYRPKIVTI